MATWSELEAAEPEIARAARELLSVPGFGFAYLATVAPDGGPRIHPVNLVWADGSLAAFIVPSPKLADLRRPPHRYALHSTGSADVDDELAVCGRAREIDDPVRRAAAVAACPFAPGDDHVLVELEVFDHVLWGHYEPRGTFPPALPALAVARRRLDPPSQRAGGAGRSSRTGPSGAGERPRRPRLGDGPGPGFRSTHRRLPCLVCPRPWSSCGTARRSRRGRSPPQR